MIKFPVELSYTGDEGIEATAWANEFRTKNSAEGAVYGRLCELALTREMTKRGHSVSLNDGNNRNDLFWDLIIDGVKIDVKTTKENSFTFSQQVIQNLFDGSDKLFVCYSFEDDVFKLVGVITTDDVKRNIRDSKFNHGYYIMKYVVKANGHQSLK